MAGKKKEKSSISLPKAWQSVKHTNEMKQTRADLNSLWGLIFGIIIALIIAFILLGGISQRGLVETVFKWSETVGNKVSEWLDKDVEVTDDGIYVNPNKSGGFTNDNTADTINQDTEQPEQAPAVDSNNIESSNKENNDSENISS